MDRAKLGFAEAAEDAFRFLSDYGFRLLSAEDTIIRYASESIFVNIYHGRSSYELGIEVGLVPSDASERGYPLWAFVQLTNPDEAERLRYFVATTPEEVRVGLERLVGQVKQYVERALTSDLTVFAELHRQQQVWTNEYAAEVLGRQVRPKAEEAFRNREYGRVVELLSKIEDQLTPAEMQKLSYARRHISG